MRCTAGSKPAGDACKSAMKRVQMVKECACPVTCPLSEEAVAVNAAVFLCARLWGELNREGNTCSQLTAFLAPDYCCCY